jgi:transposase
MRGRAAEYERKYAEAKRLVLVEGMSPKVVAPQLGISLYPFQRRLLREEGVDVRLPKGSGRKPDPTPEEIAEQAAEIRASWTVEETSRRWVGNHSAIRAERMARKQGAA